MFWGINKKDITFFSSWNASVKNSIISEQGCYNGKQTSLQYSTSHENWSNNLQNDEITLLTDKYEIIKEHREVLSTCLQTLTSRNILSGMYVCCYAKCS